MPLLSICLCSYCMKIIGWPVLLFKKLGKISPYTSSSESGLVSQLHQLQTPLGKLNNSNCLVYIYKKTVPYFLIQFNKRKIGFRSSWLCVKISNMKDLKRCRLRLPLLSCSKVSFPQMFLLPHYLSKGALTLDFKMLVQWKYSQIMQASSAGEWNGC